MSRTRTTAGYTWASRSDSTLKVSDFCGTEPANELGIEHCVRDSFDSRSFLSPQSSSLVVGAPAADDRGEPITPPASVVQRLSVMVRGTPSAGVPGTPRSGVPLPNWVAALFSLFLDSAALPKTGDRIPVMRGHLRACRRQGRESITLRVEKLVSYWDSLSICTTGAGK